MPGNDFENTKLGMNGWTPIAGPAEAQIVTDGVTGSATKAYSFPVMSGLHKKAEDGRLACSSRSHMEIRGCWSRLPGVDEWLSRALNSIVKE